MGNIIYLILFSLLYLCTAVVSTIHAVQFFGLANNNWLAITLAITFEIGQAAVLFSLLLSPKERSKIMPWCLMILLTAVQVMGNVFSSYKYIILNSADNIRYFTEPILFFMSPGDPMVTVTLTYIIGAILPIVALCMTSMIASYVHRPKVQQEVSQTDNNLANINISNKAEIEPKLTEVIME